MEGSPSAFEAIGSRLGLRLDREDGSGIRLVWRGARFPALLCLGIAIALLFLSVPILESIRERGLTGPAGALWYFPAMNLILLTIAFYLLSLKRSVLFDHKLRQATLERRSLFRTIRLSIPYEEIASLSLGVDQVYGGFAVAGSTAGESYPVPSLRLVLKNGETVLLDRGGRSRLEALAKRLGDATGKRLQTTAPPAGATSG